MLAFSVVLHYYGPSGLADGKIEGGFLLLSPYKFRGIRCLLSVAVTVIKNKINSEIRPQRIPDELIFFLKLVSCLRAGLVFEVSVR